MKQMANHYFRIDAHTITLPEGTLGDNRPAPLERRRREHLPATYWGLERRRNCEKQKLSTVPEEKENTRECLTAIYWG